MTLSYTQTLLTLDKQGRFRCSYCGKFRRESDFPDQPAHEHFSNSEGTITGHVHVAPACASCFSKKV